ncbi:hypothetical protein BQ8794_180096 [Mesorhizobium prunaredense]|uniref:Uncharacterized protein n=1 Tax=Mesorhizobium prunaredense TaxID=1631249 RepID=A0A1R3V4B1_9HYPH|nr:hypothetical protein BQ8794_180096 [Mesorhizobium prunaredense]
MLEPGDIVVMDNLGCHKSASSPSWPSRSDSPGSVADRLQRADEVALADLFSPSMRMLSPISTSISEKCAHS